MEAFPLAPVAFSGEPRAVPPDAPFNWLRQGWAIFAATPGVWVAMTVLLVIVFLALQIVPVVGSFVAALLLPLLVAGLLDGADNLGDAGRIEIADLFAGFSRNTAPLVVLGLLCMAAWLVIRLIVLVVAGGGIMGAGVTGFSGFFVGFALKLLLGLPLAIALWFAPALIYFNGMAPLAALQASFAASLMNWPAMLVFVLITAVLAFFCALPMGLGFLVLLPVLIGALHASYKDIFLG